MLGKGLLVSGWLICWTLSFSVGETQQFDFFQTCGSSWHWIEAKRSKVSSNSSSFAHRKFTWTSSLKNPSMTELSVLFSPRVLMVSLRSLICLDGQIILGKPKVREFFWSWIPQEDLCNGSILGVILLAAFAHDFPPFGVWSVTSFCRIRCADVFETAMFEFWSWLCYSSLIASKKRVWDMLMLRFMLETEFNLVPVGRAFIPQHEYHLR